MKGRYIIALDQGTTSSRAVLVDVQGNIKGIAQKEFTQYFPKPGWVEHDPQEIWASQWEVFNQVVKTNNISPVEIAAIGITNQRETTVVWERKTGNPVYPAIVWQDRRTASICEDLRKQGLTSYIQQNTGLVIDAYFSGTKLKWILDNVPELRKKAENGEICFGTVDSWLVWKLTNGQVHATDYSNASRTMLYNIKSLQWDEHLLQKLNIPKAMLPEARESSGYFGDFLYEGTQIPITGVAGDQHAALFGQACFEEGMAKNTYGTGCFLLMNTGKTMYESKNGLVSSIAWGMNGKVEYVLEGSIFIAGAAIQWLRDGLKIIDSATDSEYFASKSPDSEQVYVVPAFAGLGAPYWDMYARGAIFGLTRDTGKSHLIKATLQAIGYQTKDVLLAMEEDTGLKLKSLKVDGGACANNILMQFQADILGCQVERPVNIESTALGAAYFAGIATGLWTKEEITRFRKVDKTFSPNMSPEQTDKLYRGWQKAVKRAMKWVEED
jgi:glycerol kinase